MARQTMVCGVNLRVSNSLIFSTRCVLVREVFGYGIRDQLLVGSLLKQDMENFFENHKSPSAEERKGNGKTKKQKDDAEDEDPNREQRRKFQDMFQEIVDYLYDLEAPPDALKIGESRRHVLATARAEQIWDSYFPETAAIEKRRVMLVLELQRVNRAREKLREKITKAGGAGYFSTDGVELLGLGGDAEINWAAKRLIADGIANESEIEKARSHD
jgi:hypothetical protein